MRVTAYWVSLMLAALTLTYFADAKVSHGAYLWGFTILNLLLLRIIQIGRISWFFAFMAVFFFLGCWLKVVVHHIFDYSYVEPFGNFGGTEDEWHSYYLTAGLIGLALIAARSFIWIFEVGQKTLPIRQKQAIPVKTYEWISILTLAIIFYIINTQFAFFVTGVNAKLTLPFSLNAPLAFMALIGFAVVASTYLARDVAAAQELSAKSVVAVLLISAVASVSMASRAAIVMQAVPMLIAATYVQATIGSRTISIRPYLMFGAFLSGVLILVSIYRINVFSESSAEDTELLGSYALQTSMLFVDRWIGAEAIMVAIAEPSSSMNLAVNLFQEDPSIGSSSIYQVLSGGQYKFLDEFTFLTLPGYFGVLSLSGSSFAIFFGTLLLTLSGMLYEFFVRKILFEQVICVAVVSAALANSLTQLSFPRLFIPFLFQMTALILMLRILNRKNFY